jgi:hypothetical protein
MKGIVIDFAARNDRDFRIQQIDEAAQDAALSLTAQAEQNKIVARKKRIDDLRNDRVVVTVNAGKDRFASFDGAEEISANFVLDRAL